MYVLSFNIFGSKVLFHGPQAITYLSAEILFPLNNIDLLLSIFLSSILTSPIKNFPPSWLNFLTTFLQHLLAINAPAFFSKYILFISSKCINGYFFFASDFEISSIECPTFSIWTFDFVT